jgi:hypothetical protein
METIPLKRDSPISSSAASSGSMGLLSFALTIRTIAFSAIGIPHVSRIVSIEDFIRGHRIELVEAIVDNNSNSWRF